ncbi:unnamed protein product [Gongylonema pulchrum]|uniref:Uncharacterized protein n=1 Tax=Gongylonema pulchrum TaxID=637853 RepID=A0A183E8N7_9BILA|nr:unnamed protein product [Gongylonema pulchrum]
MEPYVRCGTGERGVSVVVDIMESIAQTKRRSVSMKDAMAAPVSNTSISYCPITFVDVIQVCSEFVMEPASFRLEFKFL